MTIRVAINGFGRIGRAVTRILHQRQDVELVAINDLTGSPQLAHSLKYDSVYGRFPDEVRAEESTLYIGRWGARVTAERDPAALKWNELAVDFVLESTGVFRKRTDLEKHLAAGAPKVLLSVPPKDELDATIVMGVNDHSLTGAERLVSNASCTTNATAPITKILHDAFEIKRGFINTIHAYTNGQRLVDYPHKDWRRSRAAPLSIIPTSTGAAKAVADVLPDLKGKLTGMAYRVPVPVGSIVDLVYEVGQKVDTETVNRVVREATEGAYHNIVKYETDPVVSCDIVGDPHSSIFDAALTQVIDGQVIHVSSWYDNEWGYSNRMVDLMVHIDNLAKK